MLVRATRRKLTCRLVLWERQQDKLVQPRKQRSIRKSQGEDFARQLKAGDGEEDEREMLSPKAREARRDSEEEGF